MLATISMELVTCCVCKVPFALTEHHAKKLQSDSTIFYCPNGHVQVYNNSEISKLKAEISRLRTENISLKNKQSEVAKAAQAAGRMVRIGIPRKEYIWSKEDKDKLIAIRHENPKLPWNEIGEKLGKSGAKCASMYHGMKARGQVLHKGEMT